MTQELRIADCGFRNTGDGASGAGSGAREAAEARSRRAGERIILGAIWAIYAGLTWRFYFVCDDAYISFRYAKHLAQGLGLRFNPGEQPPVEGYSNFLWVAGAAVCEWLRLPVTFVMPLLSLAAGSVLLVLVNRAARQRLGLSVGAAALGALLLAASVPYAAWSTSGLETMPFALMVFVVFERLVLREGGPAALRGAIAALALALLRIEGIHWAVAIGVLAIAARAIERGGKATTTQRAAWRWAVIYFGVLLGGYAIYFAWRWTYFGVPMPNPYYVKVGVSAESLARGWRYVAVFYLTFISAGAAMLGVAPALARGRSRCGWPIAAMALAVPAYAVLVGGDFMAMGRLIVPGLAFHALLLALLIDGLGGRAAWRRALTAMAGLAVIVVGALPGWDVHVIPKSVRERFHFRHNTTAFRSELAQWQYMNTNGQMWSEIGQALATIERPGESMVSDVIGALGYHTNLFLYDQHGLVTREVALGPAANERRSPGHDKYVPRAYFLKDRPTYWDTILISGPDVMPASRALAAQWSQEPGMSMYAPQFIALDATTREGYRKYLLLRRLPPAGATTEQMWREFAAQTAAPTRTTGEGSNSVNRSGPANEQ